MKRTNHGAVMVVTLAAMTCLVGVMVTIAATNREQLHAAENRMLTTRAELAAKSGIQFAINTLQQMDSKATTQSDDWYSLGQNGATFMAVGSDGFRIQILDRSAEVNMNLAAEDQLKHLPLTEEQVASLLDWRDSATTARPQGAKDDYYHALTNPYNAKLKPLDSTSELLLIKGFTPEAVYGNGQKAALEDMLTTESTSSDKQVSGTVKTDANSATVQDFVSVGVPQDLANAILQARTGSFSHMSDILKVQGMTKLAAHAIVDNFTIGSTGQTSGLININTASGQVLQTLPNVTDDTVNSIVNRQSVGFKSIGEVLDLPGMELTSYLPIVDYICVTSRTFDVRVLGMASRMKVGLDAFVSVSDKGQVTIEHIEPYPFEDFGRHWGWAAEPTSREVIYSAP